MLNQLIQLILLVIASIIVMIFHEIPKSIVYEIMSNHGNKTDKENIFALYQYIDPIGLIFCITNMAGFSKPYVYRLNDKRLSKTLAITGYFSLLSVFAISMVMLNIMNFRFQGLSINDISLASNYGYTFILYLASISMGMFLINLFPIATFDMGLLIASKSTDKFYFIISNDYFIKVFLILFLLFNIFSNVTFLIINFCMFI